MSISPTTPERSGPLAADASKPGLTTPVAVSSPSALPAAPVELPNAVKSTDAASNLEQLKNAVDKVNSVVQTMTNDVRFTLDSDTGIHVVKVVDTKTQETIRQYPSEEMIDLAKSIDKLRGLIVRQTA